VLVAAFPAPDAGRGDTREALADRCERFFLSLGDDEHVTAQDGLVWQAPGDVEPVAFSAWRQIFGSLFIARPHVRLVQSDAYKIVVARIRENDATRPHIPAQ